MSSRGRVEPPSQASEPAVLIDSSVAGTQRLRLNRPARRNAVDRSVLDGLRNAMVDAPPVTVIESADPSAFCAGLDLDVADDERAELSDGLYELYEQMIGSDSVIVVVLTGAAVGAGAQLALAADLRIMHPDAWLRFPGVGHGLAVGAWGLPSLVGRGRAMRICLTMAKVTAPEALHWGLADVVDEYPAHRGIEIAEELARRDSGALARVKRITADGVRLAESLSRERQANRATWSGTTEGLDDPRTARG